MGIMHSGESKGEEFSEIKNVVFRDVLRKRELGIAMEGSGAGQFIDSPF